MNAREKQLDEFFDDYCTSYNQGINDELSDRDLERLAGLYSAYFMSADPNGVHCAENDEQFKSAMGKGYAFYREIGITNMAILAKEITLLDDFHAMSKIRFRASFTHKDGKTGNVDFDNIYFTQGKNGKLQVFAYISGDEQQTLKDSGLL